MHWKYNNTDKTWHATDCIADIIAESQDGNNNCAPCHIAENKIRKKTYLWLFQGTSVNTAAINNAMEPTSVLPSDNEILLYIQEIFQMTVENHTSSEVKEVFMSDI